MNAFVKWMHRRAERLQRPPLEDLWGRVHRQWRRSNLPIGTGVGQQAIADFQLRYQVVLPSAVCAYFLAADGTGDEMDDECFRFWPLAKVKPVDDYLRDDYGVVHSERFCFPDCFVFMDCLLDSWCYAVKLTNDPSQPAPVFVVLGGDRAEGPLKAASFTEFMERYAEDPGKLY